MGSHTTGERINACGSTGAFWDDIWGGLLLASVVFVLPGLGLVGMAVPLWPRCLRRWKVPSGLKFAAWLGLVPGQTSSGGRVRLLGISKRGDIYLRTLLIHGARAILQHVKEK